ncbi:MAG: extensin family protein, partial [Kofleriaceae bacterium]
RIVTPITVPAMEFGGVQLTPTYKQPPFTMDCHLALGLATHLPRLAGYGVAEVLFSRIYGNTRVRSHGRTGAARSRHALGLAIDMRAFVKDDGTKVVVLDDYPLADELLLTIEAELNESGGFRSLLTPSNDPESHDDHYHLEVKVAYPTKVPRKPTS